MESIARKLDDDWRCDIELPHIMNFLKVGIIREFDHNRKMAPEGGIVCCS